MGDRVARFMDVIDPQHAYATVSDTELVGIAQADMDAFAELYRRYANRVFRYLLTYSNDTDVAADLTQQVFVQSLRAIPRYQDRGIPVAAWLFRIARNAATDDSRRQKRYVPWDDREQDSESASDPESEYLRQERVVRLKAAISRLPAWKQELLALRFAGDLTHREIGTVVGKKDATVQKQIRRILESLRDECHGS
jgi:RNA polymerase sigma-70 factor, ECF subfamily